MSPISNSLKDNKAYVLTSLVLSKEKPFTSHEIYRELKDQGVNESEYVVGRRLNRLRDRGILYEQGSYYCLAV